MAENKFPLAEVLGSISSEIRKAHEATTHDHAIMKFQECEFEFAVEAENKVDGGFHIWVLQFGAGATQSQTNTVKIKYTALADAQWVAAILQEQGIAEKIERKGQKVKE